MFDDEQGIKNNEHGDQRPLSMVLLACLYLFFFVLTLSTYGNPLPFMGNIFAGKTSKIIVFVDSMVMLYLFLGLMKRQKITWFLLLAYNVFEVVNTVVNLVYISSFEVEKIAGKPVDPEALLLNNVIVMVAILLLTLFIYRQRPYFTNDSKYIF